MATDTRVAPGFQALRLRYVRRAEYLARQADYRGAVSQMQRRWNDEFPEYRVERETSEDGHVGPPKQLRIDALRDMKSQLHVLGDQLKKRSIPESISMHRSEEAMHRWIYLVAGAAMRWFPFDDFPNPYAGDALHPGGRFIQASLFTDARMIDVEAVFPAFVLTPEEGAPLKGLNSGWRLVETMWSGGGPSLYLPLYPGMTVSDLRAAEQAIVNRVAEHFRDRTAEARVRFYRSEGCGPTEIANKLGLTVGNVNRVLAAGDVA